MSRLLRYLLATRAGSGPAPATAVTFTGPLSGTVGVQSSDFTIGANGAITGTINVTVHDSSDGSWTSSTVALDPTHTTRTTKYTAASSGTKTLFITNDRALTNAPARSYTANPATLGSKHSYVVGKLGYSEGNYPFIDIFKVGVGWNQTSGTVVKNSEGWLTTLAPGASASSYVAVSAFWVPPGNYKCVSTSAASISLSLCLGLTNVVDGSPHLATFTVPDNGPDGGNWLNTWIKPAVVNATGANISVMDFKVYRVQNESLLQGGGDDSIFDPDYLAGLQGAAFLRFTEWMGMNHTGGNYTPDGMWKFTDFGAQTLNKASYAHIEGANGPCIPAMLALCRKIGARPWIPIGNAGNCALLNYTHTDNLFHVAAWYNNTIDGLNRFVNGVGIRATTNPASLSGSGMTPRSTTYYVVNATPYPGTFQLAATIGGTPIVASSVDIATYGDGVGLANFSSALWCQVTGMDEYNDMFLPFAQCVFANDPNCQPLIDYSNEVWNSGYGSYVYAKEIIAGIKLSAGNVSTGYLWMLMKLFKAFEVTFPSSQVGRVVAWATNTLEGNLAMTGVGEGLQHLDSANSFDSTKTYGQILLQAPSRCYYAVAPYINGANSATDYAGSSQHGPGGFKANDAYAFNGNSTTYTDAFWDSCFAASMDYNQNHSQAGMAAIRTSLNTYLPGVNLCFYEWGQQVFYGLSADAKWKVTGDSLSAYLSGSAGAAMYQRAWDTTVTPYNVAFVNHYSSEGSWYISTSAFSRWGIRDQNTDNATSVWFRTK